MTRVHWPSVRGRARADAGLLLLVAVVVAVVALLAGATPALLRSTADDAVRDATRTAGDDASVVAVADWEYDDAPGGRIRVPALAQDVAQLRDRADGALNPALAAVLRPPAAVVTGPSFDVTDGSLLRTFRFTYLADERGPLSKDRVTWVAGREPRSSAPPGEEDLVVPRSGPPWPVQVGLSEAAATALRVGPGDRIPVKDEFLRVKLVTVSGVYRPADSADPAWRLAPWLLGPVSGVDGVGSTRFGGLLSAGSLPDARLAVEQEELERAVHFEPDPAAMSSGAARPVTATLVTLKATSSVATLHDASLQWRTQLDTVLRTVQMRVNAATAQATVLLAAVLAGAILVLILAAALLAGRRAQALTAARQRGAGLADLATELVIESAAVALAAAAAGLAVARLVTPGVAWWWPIPVVVAAAAAGPVCGVLVAARATRDRRTPANRTARRRLRRTALLRRAAAEAAVVFVAAGALVALRQRGILPVTAEPSGGALDVFAGQDSTSALAASAPALGVLAAALLLVRLVPPTLRYALRQALRSRRSLAVFGIAQAAAATARTLPTVVMTAAVALATFALTLGTTATRGLDDTAWRVVGADIRVTADPAEGADLPALARRVAAAPGVEHVATAQVIEGARITNDTVLVTPRLVIADARAYRALLAGTPIAAPALADLGGGGELRALVRSGDGSLRPGMRLEFARKDAPPVRLAAVGQAPPVGDNDDVVIVDATALTAAGIEVVPNTLWATGPGAAEAVAGTPGAEVTTRATVLEERRNAPLTAGLVRLAWVAAATLAAFALLGFALGAAAGAPGRWVTLGRLRTLGLRVRETRLVAAGELLPTVLVAALAGPALGILLAALTFGSLAVRLLIGWDTDPQIAVPWPATALLAALLPAAVPVVVAAEARLRSRQGLGELLRVGG